MSRVTEIARLLHCTESNVCRLLREGKIQGTALLTGGWYLNRRSRSTWTVRNPNFIPLKTNYTKGRSLDTGLFWTLNPEKIRMRRERLWFSASAGKRKESSLWTWLMAIVVPVGAVVQKTFARGNRKARKKARKLWAGSIRRD